MAKTIVLIVSIVLIAALLVVGCVQKQEPTQVADTEPTADADVSDITQDVEDLENVDEELGLGELDTLSSDLDNLI